jgi:hypothetical protein
MVRETPHTPHAPFGALWGAQRGSTRARSPLESRNGFWPNGQRDGPRPTYTKAR